MALADLVHMNGLAECMLCVSVKRRISSRSSLTLLKTARLRARRSNCANQVSTALSHDALVGVKCRSKRGWAARRVFRPATLGKCSPVGRGPAVLLIGCAAGPTYAAAGGVHDVETARIGKLRNVGLWMITAADDTLIEAFAERKVGTIKVALE